MTESKRTVLPLAGHSRLPLPDGETLANHIHDTDAGGNCRYVGCDYNADIDYVERVTRGEDVYGDVPETLNDLMERERTTTAKQARRERASQEGRIRHCYYDQRCHTFLGCLCECDGCLPTANKEDR